MNKPPDGNGSDGHGRPRPPLGGAPLRPGPAAPPYPPRTAPASTPGTPPAGGAGVRPLQPQQPPLQRPAAPQPSPVQRPPYPPAAPVTRPQVPPDQSAPPMPPQHRYAAPHSPSSQNPPSHLPGSSAGASQPGGGPAVHAAGTRFSGQATRAADSGTRLEDLERLYESAPRADYPAAGRHEPAPPAAGTPAPMRADYGAPNVPLLDPNRMTPRSPRAALEPERVAVPTRRSKRARHPLVIIGNAIFTLILLIALGLGGLVFWGKQRFEAPGPLADNKIVNIPRGGVRDIAELLAREGVISEPWVFIGGALALKARGEDLKFGEYQFASRSSMRDVAETIIEGKVVQHMLTLPEGLTSEQIVARLLENEVLTGNIREIPREGSLLPESYRFTRGTTREQMIQRMQQAQARVIKEVWDRRMPDLPLRRPEDLITLASIVEKETGKPEERTRVAAVFLNRLKQNMKLQSDPTIIYGLVGGKGSLGRPILKSEIEQPTPYNTYVIAGLPPGPIANPGRASLEAAVNPARTKELYFVADGTGGHAFAENYDQHLRNVARLRALEREQKETPDSAPPAAAPEPAAPQPAARPPQRRTQANPAANPQPSATRNGGAPARP